MLGKIYHRFDLLLLLILSFLGLLMFVITSFSLPLSYEYFLFRKLIIGLAFGLLCILGIIAAILPKECSKIFYCKKDITREKPISSNNASFIFGLRIVHGHHPSCENFSSHELRIKDKSFCAGCTGLIIGTLLSLFGTIIYFSTNLFIPTFFIIIGLLGVVLGLILPLLNLKQTILRLFINAFFIFGVFLMLIGVDSLVQSVFFDLFLISLSIFCLFTRISFSQWNHLRICHECGNKCRLKAA
ncbi:MAG: hypothetical protein QXL46_05680 [Nitrososphaerales archaeon]